MKSAKGFTLIELMIVVAVIALLAMIAMPTFLAYRDKSRIAAATDTATSIRSALAGYAAVEKDALFPAASEISDWNSLATLCDNHGATLTSRELQQGLGFKSYSDLGTRSSYYLLLTVKGVPNDITGSQLEIRPSGIIRQTF